MTRDRLWWLESGGKHVYSFSKFGEMVVSVALFFVLYLRL